jgi:hypothetical protein
MPTHIELMYLDLETCIRCRDTDHNLEAALEAASESLAHIGAEVAVNKIHITSAEQARELRFVSSPTLRVNGRDVALELRESSCASEACADGCGESIDCRVWVHEGREYTKPPVPMIVDAILREARRSPTETQDTGAFPFELPENLKRFFAAKDAVVTTAHEATEHPATSECCSPTEQRDCCDTGDKAECCGAGGETCGCR